MPPGALWNGDLVVYAHGYVSPTEPVGIPEDQMVLPGTGHLVGRRCHQPGLWLCHDQLQHQRAGGAPGPGRPGRRGGHFCQGKGDAWQGLPGRRVRRGLITTLAVEGEPQVFDGGLALCGPYGDFVHQVDHLGDMRAVFDYFFPGLIQGSAVDIPAWLVMGWEAYYETTVLPALQDPANAGKVSQLLQVTQMPYDPLQPGAREEAIYDVLSYNIVGTNDARGKLGGQPFDNVDRVYTGSSDDGRLNRLIKRYGADAAALAEIEAGYQTSGELEAPLVTLHTTGDHVVSYWQMTRYRAKTIGADNIALHEARTAPRYGHCQFEATEVLDAFNRLVAMVNDPPPYRPVQRLFLPLVARAD